MFCYEVWELFGRSCSKNYIYNTARRHGVPMPMKLRYTASGALNCQHFYDDAAIIAAMEKEGFRKMEDKEKEKRKLVELSMRLQTVANDLLRLVVAVQNAGKRPLIDALSEAAKRVEKANSMLKVDLAAQGILTIEGEK